MAARAIQAQGARAGRLLLVPSSTRAVQALLSHASFLLAALCFPSLACQLFLQRPLCCEGSRGRSDVANIVLSRHFSASVGAVQRR
jgi:hypothetical protein